MFPRSSVYSLIIATLISTWLLGTRQGYTRNELLDISTKALAPAGMIILIIGSGGEFKQMLIDSGVGDVLAQSISKQSSDHPRLHHCSGSPHHPGLRHSLDDHSGRYCRTYIKSYTLSDIHCALIVISIASGATILSHVNDSGFWLVGKYFGLTEIQTLKSWTVMETIITLGGFAFALLFSFFV
ncbi:MAG: gluconate permease [Parabacteroides johnsonii]